MNYLPVKEAKFSPIRRLSPTTNNLMNREFTPLSPIFLSVKKMRFLGGAGHNKKNRSRARKILAWLAHIEETDTDMITTTCTSAAMIRQRVIIFWGTHAQTFPTTLAKVLTGIISVGQLAKRLACLEIAN